MTKFTDLQKDLSSLNKKISDKAEELKAFDNKKASFETFIGNIVNTKNVLAIPEEDQADFTKYIVLVNEYRSLVRLIGDCIGDLDDAQQSHMNFNWKRERVYKPRPKKAYEQPSNVNVVVVNDELKVEDVNV